MASNTAYSNAQKFFKRKDIDNAIHSANLSLLHSPFNLEAQTLLRQAKSVRLQADTFYQRSLTQTQNHNFDQAILTLNQTLTLFPEHPKAKSYAPIITNQAAIHYTQAAEKFAVNNQFIEAQLSFKKALFYRSNHSPATQGLATIYHIYATKAIANNLPGSSLLWAKKAHKLNPIHSHQLIIDAAKKQIYLDTQFNLKLDTTHLNTITANDAQIFNTTTSTHLTLMDKPYINLKAPNDENPTYEINSHITSLSTSTRRIASRKRTHSYNVTVQVTNPEIEETRMQIRNKQVSLGNALRDFNTVCRHCHGHHHRRCGHCHGTGFINRSNYCSACNSYSCSISSHHIHYRSRRIDCHHCHHGHNTCGHCHSTGRHYWRITQTHINNLSNQITRLNHRLTSLPQTVPAIENRSWPYTLETHKISAMIRGTLTIKTPDSPNAGSTKIDLDQSYQDNTIINDNPSIGLMPNALNLPKPSVYLTTLNKTAAHKASKQIIQIATTLRANAMLKISQTLANVNQHIPAQEAAIAAALLYETSEPNKARMMYRDMMRKEQPLAAPAPATKAKEKTKPSHPKVLLIT